MSTKIIKAGVLVSTATIKTPDNFAALLAMPRIKRLASSIKAVTQIAPVVLQKAGDGYKLWAGHDRLAAATLAGRTTIRADVRQGSDADFLLLQIAENAERRPIGELIDEYRQAASDEPLMTSDVNPRKSTTYGKSATARQDQEIADARGVSADAERKRRERSRAAKREQVMAEASAAKVAEGDAVVADAALAAPLPDGFNAFGLEVAPEHRDRIEMLATMLEAWSRVTTNLLTELARVAKVANPPLLSRQAAESIRDKAHALGHVIREAIPTSLCFYCKNDDRAVVDCAACGATGLAGRHGGDNVPPELKTQGVKARIALDGQFVPVPGVAPSPTGILTGGSKHGPAVGAKPASKRGIRVVAVDAAGNEVNVPLEDDAEELAF